VDWPFLNPNAQYSPRIGSPDLIKLGKAIPNECETMTSLDVIGHEYTHGIVEYSSAFLYYGESGALEESFCDIFGNVIQEWVEGYNFNKFYTQAEDPIIGTGGLRALHDPLNSGKHPVKIGSNCYYYTGHPDTYEGQYWYEGDCDYGGVHCNCGVQNYWFYLLAHGGYHNGITINPIGIDKAAKIAYRNMVTLTTYDEYDEAREGAIDAAEYYYGYCSDEFIQTMNAWAAVGVGDPAPDPCDPPLSVYITGPEMLYFGDYGTWVAHPSGGIGNYSYDWYVDYGWGWEGPYGHQASYTDRMMPAEDWMDLRVDVTSGEQQASDIRFVICLDCEGGPMGAMVFPNPAEGFLNVTIEEAESIESAKLKGKKIDGSLKNKNEYSGDIIYTMFNNYGQTVYYNRTNEKRIRINTSNIPDGIYTLKIVLKDGIITKQVVIHK